MLLRYTKGDVVTVWERARALGRRRPYTFSPVGDVPENVARRLLVNPRFMGMFEKVFPYKCGLCGKECLSKAGLLSHERKHKGEK